MRTFLAPVIVTCLLLLPARCAAQTAKPESDTSDTQSRRFDGPITGDSCTFQEVSEVKTYPNCFFKDSQGNLFVGSNYVKKMRFNSEDLSAVWDEDDPRHKFMYIDRKGRVLIQGVPISDNWAEEFSNGLVAIVINEKYGFADRHGKIVIEPKYDGAGPFKDGYAVVCMGCVETCIIPSDAKAPSIDDCEHRTMAGGEWFKINRAGRIVASVPAR